MARIESRRKFGFTARIVNLPFTLESRKGNYQTRHLSRNFRPDSANYRILASVNIQKQFLHGNGENESLCNYFSNLNHRLILLFLIILHVSHFGVYEISLVLIHLVVIATLLPSSGWVSLFFRRQSPTQTARHQGCKKYEILTLICDDGIWKR